MTPSREKISGAQITPEENSVVVIGGNGFIGRHVTRALKEEFEVRVFDRPGIASEEGVAFFPGDLAAGPEELHPCLAGCRTMVYLVHLAGNSPHRDPDMLSLVKNLELFLTALEAAAKSGIQRVVFFSSGGAIYGNPKTIPIPESHPLEPISAYGLCKLTMEKYLAMFCSRHGMNHVALRPSNPFGPGQDFRRLQGVVSVFMHRILQDQPIEIWGDGKGRKDYFAVEDLGAAVAAILHHPEARGPYNVGSGQGRDLLDIVSSIERATGKKARLEYKQKQDNDVPEFVLDCSRLTSLTGWAAKTSFDDAVRKLAAWMVGNSGNTGR